MGRIYDIDWYRQHGNLYRVEKESAIPVLVSKSIWAKWVLGYSLRRIAAEIRFEHGIDLGDNAICDIVRDWQRRVTATAVAKAERRGRLMNWPAVGLRAVAA